MPNCGCDGIAPVRGGDGKEQLSLEEKGPVVKKDLDRLDTIANLATKAGAAMSQLMDKVPLCKSIAMETKVEPATISWECQLHFRY